MHALSPVLCEQPGTYEWDAFLEVGGAFLASHAAVHEALQGTRGNSAELPTAGDATTYAFFFAEW
jgi:hypothetical protein